jgi:hypothetical protein
VHAAQHTTVSGATAAIAYTLQQRLDANNISRFYSKFQNGRSSPWQLAQLL